MIRVVNIRSPLGITQRIYCGRPGKGEKGLLGNPFRVTTEAERDESCDSFQLWFADVIELKGNTRVYNQQGMRMYPEIKRLELLSLVENIELACFCKPKRCHCDTIKAHLDSYRLKHYTGRES